MKVVVLGGGISGRIVKYFFPGATVLELREEFDPSELTVNFGTNYLWKPLPGFECEPIKVYTSVDGRMPEESSIKRYKNKIGKGYENREDYMEQFKPEVTGYLIKGYPKCDINYGMKVVSIVPEAKLVTYVHVKTNQMHTLKYDFLFSTLALPTLLKLAGLQNMYPVETMFKSKPIYIRMDKDPSDGFGFVHRPMLYVNYISDPTVPHYRVTSRAGWVHTESLSRMTVTDRVIYPGKIYDDPLVMSTWIYLHGVGICPVGRFGKWVSDELIHNTYEDVGKLAEELK